MAKAKKRAVSKLKTKTPAVTKKVKTQKAPARKPTAKTTKRKTTTKRKIATTKSKSASKNISINALKSLVSQMEKAPIHAIASAKKLLQYPNKQAHQLISHYKKQAQQVSKQWAAAQKKLGAAEAKLAKQASSASKNAVKSAQKTYEAAVKKAEQLNKEYDIAHTVSHQVKSLSSKFDYLAKEVVKAANSWIAPAAKPAKKPVSTKKPLGKKPVVKTSAKPSIPSQVQKPITQAPVRNPLSYVPITPQNIAQKPLIGGASGSTTQQPKPDAGQNKPFNFNKDDF